MKLPSYLSAICLALLFSIQSASADVSTADLPEFGDSAGSVISPETERRIGEAVLRQARKRATIVDDPEVQSYIRSLGYQLLSNSDDAGKDYTFFVIRDPRINAFAAPGGVIAMNSGVFLNSESESELAGVMAHEIAHVTQHHMARMFEKQEQLSMPMLAGLVASVLVGIANPQAGMATATALAGAQQQYAINFTRSNEQEADRIGMKILARSDYDPRGMARFFERLQRTSRFYDGNAPEFLRTHPVTSSRIAEAKARASEYPNMGIHDSESFELIRMKLMARSGDNAIDAMKKMREVFAQAQRKDKNVMPARYGYAIALMDANRYPEAEQHVRRLLEHDSEKPAFMLLDAELDVAQQNYQAALSTYEAMQNLYPNYRPLILAWSRALLDAGQPNKTRDILRSYGRTRETSQQYYELLARAEGMAGNEIEAGIAKAEHFYLIGDTQLAIERIRHTQRQSGIDYYQQQRIESHLSRYERERQLERELRI